MLIFKNRAVHGLFVHDAMLARMFHHAPLLRHDTMTVPAAADDDLFHAPNASIWKQILLRQPSTQPLLNHCLHVNLQHHEVTHPMSEELRLKSGLFTAYVVLNGISASISERQQAGQLLPTSVAFDQHFDALMCWYFTFVNGTELQSSNIQSPSDVFRHMIMVLWHCTFMALVTNFNILERAAGREGLEDGTEEADVAYARQWANSQHAQRCMIHAHDLLFSLGAMRLDAEPAIHIPHCLFLAGIACHAYTKFRHSQRETPPDVSLQGQKAPDSRHTLDIPEFTLRGAPVPIHLFETSKAPSQNLNVAQNGRALGDNPQEPRHRRLGPDIGPGMMFTVIDLLQRIGHWGIARKYATTLAILAQTDGDEDWMLFMND